MSRRTARRRDLRLLPIAAVAWAGTGVAILAPDAASTLALVLWPTSALTLLLARRLRWTTTLAVAAVALAVAAAAASHVAIGQPARAALADLPVDGGRSVTFAVDVVGKVERSATGYRFDAVTRSVRIGSETRHAAAPVLVRIGDRPHGLDLGSTLEVTGTAFEADAGDRAVLVVEGASTDRIRAPTGALAVAASLRQGLVVAVEGLPAPAAGLVPGLAVGDTSAVGDDLDAQMKAASLSHLTAVSGANCALVVGIAFGIAAWCGARRSVRVAAGLLTLVAFVVLVSPEPSVVRAATMAAIAMLGVLLGRIGAGVSVLAVSVCVLLILDPWIAASLGFALSTVATASLLLFAGPLADGLSRWMPSPAALALSVPLAAQLACGPLIVLIEPTVPVFGVLANLLAGPAAPAATVLGLLACVALPVPVLAQGLAAIAWLPAAWIAGTAQLFSALPGTSLAWLEGLPGLLALAAGGAALGVVVGVRHAAARRWASAVLAGILVVAVAAGPARVLWDRARVPPDWTIAACEVGQGDAVLVRSAGETMLIDTGPDPAALHGCLERFSVDRLDIVVLTHFDLDHKGGADAVLERSDVLLHGPIAAPEDASLVAAFADAGAETEQVSAGQRGRLGRCAWSVLWPKRDDPVYPSGNDASVIVEMTGCETPDALFLGDLSAQAQRSLAATGALPGSADVVKVAHHGSADQDPVLYEQLDAALALVTVGENTYGHPRDEILDLLRTEDATIARTDLSGDIALWRDGEHLRVWRSRDGAR
ncbi:ComEC/Rec2 family competence protein [Microbacterium sp. EYE_5]|uniref:ComEC/Rec2 family competence protein n=1 Tax=unclassified Microbacterium TaxID=2609290 RepID=UPI0020042510|nr:MULTISPECIES: ComEC/Rec2 family competence protein [unclassified Microbacterium]MCK6080599.1 ComEC/Rec2 family competence protein [Microbacterium sp. EYE_382]MCK6085870.1 ComEC/Rec2 family competence protein [Microbacterium sp. EYE_384]MCK6124632.1 ComEC/Rec2 family competence protein [Microbacterium sp. EYE_80]MCK6127541.1 ComEC/Rec2 family competence protein [Microbacterium sp. EYE_79]MCK6141554.1 ComEC/Rec2 family competence protein [Microbacterium sp. EYE_39]